MYFKLMLSDRRNHCQSTFSSIAVVLRCLCVQCQGNWISNVKEIKMTVPGEPLLVSIYFTLLTHCPCLILWTVYCALHACRTALFILRRTGESCFFFDFVRFSSTNAMCRCCVNREQSKPRFDPEFKAGLCFLFEARCCRQMEHFIFISIHLFLAS